MGFVIQGVVLTETFVHVLFNSNLTEENDCYCLEWPLLTGSIINNTCTLSVPFDPLDNKNTLHNSYGPSQRPNPHCQHRSQALSSLPPSSLLACGIPSRLIPSLQIFQGTSVPPSWEWLWSRVGGTRNAPSVVYMLNWLILLLICFFFLKVRRQVCGRGLIEKVNSFLTSRCLNCPMRQLLFKLFTSLTCHQGPSPT